MLVFVCSSERSGLRCWPGDFGPIFASRGSAIRIGYGSMVKITLSEYNKVVT